MHKYFGSYFLSAVQKSPRCRDVDVFSTGHARRYAGREVVFFVEPLLTRQFILCCAMLSGLALFGDILCPVYPHTQEKAKMQKDSAWT
jgi:hypothetical protein